MKYRLESRVRWLPFSALAFCSVVTVTVLSMSPQTAEAISLLDGLAARIAARALPSAASENVLGPLTAIQVIVYCTMLVGGAHLVTKCARFSRPKSGWIVACTLAGAPAGVLAVLAWTVVSPMRGHILSIKYAPTWGMTVAALSALLTVALARSAPAQPVPKESGSFDPRSWVLPAIVVVWVTIRGLADVLWPGAGFTNAAWRLLGWLPTYVADLPGLVVALLGVGAAAYFAYKAERALRQRLPTGGLSGRSFVLAWIALLTAPVAYALVVAVWDGMIPIAGQNPLSPAWLLEYVEDVGATLVASPAQLSVTPLLLALASTGIQRLLPPVSPMPLPDPEAPRRGWSLEAAGTALASMLAIVALASSVPDLAVRLASPPAPGGEWRLTVLRGWSFLTPPEHPTSQFWALAAGVLVLTCSLVYLTARGQIAHLFTPTAYLPMWGALALAIAVAVPVSGLLASPQTPSPLPTPAQAAVFVVLIAPALALVLALTHMNRIGWAMIKALDLDHFPEAKDTGAVWEKLSERYQAWKERAQAHKTTPAERRAIALKAGICGLTVALLTGAAHALALGVPLGRTAIPDNGLFLALPEIRLSPLEGEPRADWLLENITAALYIVLLMWLVHLGLRSVDRSAAWAVGLTVLGQSVVAGSLALGLRTVLGAWLSSSAMRAADRFETYIPLGPQLGLLTGLAAGLTVSYLRRPVWLGKVPRSRRLQAAYGCAALLLVVGALPPMTPAAKPVRLELTTHTWRERHDDERLSVNLSYPRIKGDERVNIELFAPLRARVEEMLREFERYPATADSELTNSFAIVRSDNRLVSIRYALTLTGVGAHPAYFGDVVTVDVAARRALSKEEIFVPAIRSSAGMTRLASVIRTHLPDPRTAGLLDALIRVDVADPDLGVNLGSEAVQFTLFRGLVCYSCEPVTVRVPAERLDGLLRVRP
ncbi:hypothetical protein ETD86_24660 [Nonomuraea turkmeniaca]|uniref:DUF3298 domain-containing protein n=1 Tax=Nonomuraea turkmeniaca TaxID=103838 RepID=A0A5S4FF57_9ACTN|nr:hypothetical protein [Nonomuraea turkmeniaca]TMR16669.1 hypothetical protein ETD86_24660 [Nonomuraea turkmeniaca]